MEGKRTRWIVVCEVQDDKYVMRGNAGYPHCIWIHWRGRRHPFRPLDALNWNEFMGMLDRQLRLKGLRRQDMEVRPREWTPWKEVRVLVSRHPAGKLEREIRERHKGEFEALLASVSHVVARPGRGVSATAGA